MLDRMDDTIVAISSAPGYGAVAIVRLSGPDALSIADHLAAVEGETTHMKRGRKRLLSGSSREPVKRPRGSADPLSGIAHMDGAELLSPTEVRLCEELRIVPRHYSMIKEQIIRECYQRGFLERGRATQLIKIDVNKSAKLFDFFVRVGWVKQQPEDAGAAT